MWQYSCTSMLSKTVLWKRTSTTGSNLIWKGNCSQFLTGLGSVFSFQKTRLFLHILITSQTVLSQACYWSVLASRHSHKSFCRQTKDYLYLLIPVLLSQAVGDTPTHPQNPKPKPQPNNNNKKNNKQTKLSAWLCFRQKNITFPLISGFLKCRLYPILS